VTAVIIANQLTKSYVIKKGGGRGLFRRRSAQPSTHIVEALRGVSFSVGAGERLAIIGPNGAGKSTTMKLLTGILTPTSGSVQVFGLQPERERRQLSMKLGCVFGQISNLWANLSLSENFRLFGAMYRVKRETFEERLRTLQSVFELDDLVEKTPQQLSLGERMKCAIVVGLLHAPELLLLDEPSIGLDVISRLKLRRMIREYGEKSGSTILLTSHDTGDIEGVCDRVIVVNHGKIAFDGRIEDLRQRYLHRKVIAVQLESSALALDDPRIDVTVTGEMRYSVSFHPGTIGTDEVVRKILSGGAVVDLAIQAPALEEVIAEAFRGGES
jgi:ABC-2 type transport system ATP-binding protein